MEKTFREYMRAVNAELVRQCGLTSADLEDFPYRDCFEDEVPAVDCARDALAESDFPSDCILD